MSVAEPRTEEPVAADGRVEPDVSGLLGELADDAQVMLARDLALLRAEVRLSARHVRGVGMGFGAAAVLGVLAAGVLAVAAGLGLSEVVHPAVAFLVVGLVLAAAAGVALAVGRTNLGALDPVPHETMENIREDVAWLRARMS